MFTFYRIPALADYEGPYLLLEEDYIVSEDVLHVIDLLKTHKNSITTIGSYEMSGSFDNVLYRLNNWVSSKHNIAMDNFCRFDDYNWDWSLQNTFSQSNVRDNIFHLTKSGRVFHAGVWYVYTIDLLNSLQWNALEFQIM
ncbi:Alpha-1,6-mannosyl-glycoprotein 2-beta-N-acetylglucosaminyltransferase [Cichlidogyrus casuarinus]|uniref:Alpha-1,6-mannosyl-glycoprotein 2-beta-N-acetylglucosaminyltransferase n=1 Tax=Cichlidogyrus casuarinus TaxID=1844966 RepID=A0ABD2PR82_9PLAT